MEYTFPDLESPLFGMALDRQPDGKTVLLGYTGEQSTGWDMHLVRLLPDGDLDTSFGNGGYAQVDLVNLDMPSDLDITADGAIVTGLFSQAPGVARLLLDDPTPPTPTPTATVPAIVTPTVSPTPSERMLFLPLT